MTLSGNALKQTIQETFNAGAIHAQCVSPAATGSLCAKFGIEATRTAPDGNLAAGQAVTGPNIPGMG